MKTTGFQLFATALLLILAVGAQAETGYISERLVVTVRSNKTNNYKVLATLVSASPVEILEEDNNYVKVRTEKGIEGYIRAQYVNKALPKAIQIAELEIQVTTLEKELQQLQENAVSIAEATSKGTIEQLNNELIQAQSQLEKISKDYTDLQQNSENILALTTERDQLAEENSQLSKELSVLQEENRSFHRSNMIQWFLAGGGVFLVGWLIGKISRKKRRYSHF